MFYLLGGDEASKFGGDEGLVQLDKMESHKYGD